jgi:hypothetical protein
MKLLDVLELHPDWKIDDGGEEWRAVDYLEEWRRGAEEGDRGPEVVDLLVHGQQELVAVLAPVA